MLSDRWTARARKLNIEFPYRGYDSPATQCVVFPETIALAEALCNPDWRRHVAMVHESDLDRFYRYAFRAVGIPRTLNQPPVKGDPLTFWVMNIRTEHARRRYEYWSSPLTAIGRHPVPFPNIRHFE